MEIFNSEPYNWKDLQNKVAYVLQRCGYTVETPKKIKTPRSNIEIDVYAKNSDMEILCECKLWKKNIDQGPVLAFRTVIEDVGANKGIIIAKKGFQRGAYQVATNTSIELKTWEEFLTHYKEKYLKFCIKKHLSIHKVLFRVADDKREYWNRYDALNENQKQKADMLKNQLMTIVLLMTPLCNVLRFSEDEWSVEYVDTMICRAEDSFGMSFVSYFDFFSYIERTINVIVEQIEQLYGMKIL